jgi:hypothetical protein
VCQSPVGSDYFADLDYFNYLNGFGFGIGNLESIGLVYVTVSDEPRELVGSFINDLNQFRPWTLENYIIPHGKAWTGSPQPSSISARFFLRICRETCPRTY